MVFFAAIADSPFARSVFGKTMTGSAAVYGDDDPASEVKSGTRSLRKGNTMKWEVRGMRRGQPGRWMIEAPSEDRARHKAEAAGVTLERVDPIGQITSATMAFALAAGSPGRGPRSRQLPAAWIAACAACAAVFGAGGYFLGARSAATDAFPIVHAQAAAGTASESTNNAILASSSAPSSKANAAGRPATKSQR
jgi:hypothetical protein